MKRTFIAIGVFLAAVWAGKPALAQATIIGGTDYPLVQPATPFSAGAHGVADIIRSQGAYNALTGRAAVDFAEAQRQFIQNRHAAVENYFAVRELNRDSRAKERGRRGTYEDYVRYAQAGAPARLSPSELDHGSGRITWPVLLRDTTFAANRAELEKLFALRAVSGQLSTGEFLRIDQLTRTITAELQTYVAVVPPQEYVRAKRFVQSLSYEATVRPA